MGYGGAAAGGYPQQQQQQAAASQPPYGGGQQQGQKKYSTMPEVRNLEVLSMYLLGRFNGRKMGRLFRIMNECRIMNVNCSTVGVTLTREDR